MGPVEEITAQVTRGATATAVAPEDLSGLVGNVLQMIDDPGTGGLAGLVRQFQDKGLGTLVAGWIGTGHNPPISPAQIQTVLDRRQLQQLASTSGLSLEALTEKLATVLPIVVDYLTPDGQVPQTGTPLNKALDWLDCRP